MDISSVQNALQSIQNNTLNTNSLTNDTTKANGGDFSSVFNSMLDSLNETNDLQNLAEEEEIRFALGESENTHDLLVAMTKANVALQYTVAVRDKMLEAYKEIMQMQI